MKSLTGYIIEHNCHEVTNPRFRKAMEKAGLGKILLIKDYGYFWLTSEDRETQNKLLELPSTSMYLNSFNQQSVEQWVDDIRNMVKDLNII